MITVFDDRKWRNAHQLFQRWRDANPNGFVVNIQSKGKGQIHDSGCKHMGSTDYEPAENEVYSLTKKPKICSRKVGNLTGWARDFGVQIRPCKHCRLNETTSGILSEDDYASLIEDIEINAVPIVLEEEGIVGGLPKRSNTSIRRIIRDTKLSIRVKSLHDHRCQICGNRIALPDGTKYSEAHHIQPLGEPHNGPDILGNLLCVCPNHHVELDYHAIPLGIKKLRSARGHVICREFIDYHNGLVKKATLIE